MKQSHYSSLFKFLAAFFELDAAKSNASSSNEEEAAISLVHELKKIELPNYRVVGGIVRYDESARNTLKDTKQRIVTSLTSQALGRDNYLIWAPPGSGKSFFIQEIAKSLGDKIEYTELNLAQMDEPRFRSELSQVERSNRPRLCFIDEVDSKPSESWPYENLLPSLEPPDRNTIRTCFILAGSGGNSLSEMKTKIANRPKGVDLLSRIPTRNESEIPGLALGDKLLVASTQFLRASNERGRQTDEIEKLVLYYIALNPKLKSARQIRDLAIHCIERMPYGEERVKFDYLFDAGDPENKEFWIRAGHLRNEFVNSFVRLEDDQLTFKVQSTKPEISTFDKKSLSKESIPGINRMAVVPATNVGPDKKDERHSMGENRTAAIRTFLFVDIRGYSRFTVEHGDAEALGLVARFDELSRAAFAVWHGEVIGASGDELIAVFGSARDAIRAAIEVQTRFAEEANLNQALPPVGIGLDAGEAVPAGDTFMGAALNLAGRLCKLAGPQEVLASDTVVHIAGDLSNVTYAERGFTQLKGFKAPVHVFQVIDSNHTSAQIPSAESLSLGQHNPLPIGAFLGALPSTVLVAREPELKRILGAADAVANGKGRLVLISGEPGVGKTRLAQEGMLNTRNRRFLVATGRCYEQSRTVPFYPFVDVLTNLYALSPSSIRSSVATRWPYLYRLLPEFSEQVSSGAGYTPEEQQRLFRAIVGFIEAISSGTPVAIFLDDIHWADGPSLDLLQHLARTSRASRLLIVGTYRDVEVGLNRPLESALRELEREELVERIPIHRLELGDSSKLIATVLGGRVIPSNLVRMVHGRAEGNPFFTQQLIRYLVERGEVYQMGGRWEQRSGAEVAIPESIRLVIGQRMERLTGPTQELLKEASVLGQTFRYDTLAALAVRTEQEIESSLEEANAAGLVTETQQDRYTFDHALTQQSLYADLPGRKRRRLHLAAAEDLDKLPEKERALLGAEIAWHFLEAAQEERAMPYALVAGDHAASVFAFQEAKRQYSIAIDIARRLKNMKGEIEALTHSAKLCLDLFQGTEAVRSYERLLEVALKEGDQKLELTARLGLSRAYYVVSLDEVEGDSISRCRAISETAYDLARQLGDRKAVVNALLATRYFPDFWPEFRDQWRANAKEAFTVSREDGDQELILETEIATWNQGPKRESAERGYKLISELKSRKDLYRLNKVYFNMMWAELKWGEYESCVKTCDAAIRLADEIGIPPVQYSTIRSLALLQLGRYGEAWKSIQDEVASPEHPFGQAMQSLGTAEYLWETQDFEGSALACRELQRRAAQLRRAWMSRWASGLLTRSLARTGDLDAQARSELEQETGGLQGRVPHEVMAEILLAERNLEAALREARAFADEANADGIVTNLLLAIELQARALIDLGRPGEALVLAQKGSLLAREHRNLSIDWKLLALKGHALKNLGDQEGARKVFQEAASTLKHIGSSLQDPQKESKFFASELVASTLREL